MQDLATQYCKTHKGRVTKLNDYSFEFETLPDKDGKVKKYTVMLSYFFK